MRKIKINKLHTKALVNLCFLIAICILISFFTTNIVAEEINEVQYINSNDKIEASLIPDPIQGIIPTKNNQYVTLEVDSKNHNYTLTSATSGNAKLSGKVTEIDEGKHSATLTTLTEHKSIKDSKQLLFIYDKTPPIVNLHESLSTSVVIGYSPIVLSYSDKESGVDRTNNNGVVLAQVNGKDVTLVMNDLEDGTGEIHLSSPKYDRTKSSFTLKLKVVDRAGNEQVIQKKFQSEPEIQRKEVSCDGDRWWWLNEDDLGVRIVSRPVQLSDSKEVQLELKTTNYLGNHPRLMRKVWDEFELTSNDPTIKISKVSFDSSIENSVIFKIRASGLSNPTSTLILYYPKSFNGNKKQEDCQETNENMDWDDFISPSVSFLKQEISIPVGVYNSASISSEVKQDGYNIGLIANLLCNSIDNTCFDTKTSWFEVDNKKYWFDESGYSRADAFEGKHVARVAIGSKDGVWKNNKSNTNISYSEDSRVAIQTHLMNVVYDPPRIRNFKHNRLKRVLTAEITDQGTPLQNLKIEMGSDQHPTILFVFDAVTGQLSAPYPNAYSVEEISLRVTDNASQTTTATCQVFSALEDEDNGADLVKPPVEVSIFPGRRYITGRSWYGGNQSWREKSLRRFKDKSGDSKGTCWPSEFNYTNLESGPFATGLHKISQCIQNKTCENYSYEIFTYGSYSPYFLVDSQGNRQIGTLSENRVIGLVKERNQKTLSDCGVSSFDELKRKWNAGTLKIPPGYGLSAPPKKQYYTKNVYHKTRTILPPPKCETKYVDILTPVISNVKYDVNTGQISADIHDHGAPLSEISTKIVTGPASIRRYFDSSSNSFRYIQERSNTSQIISSKYNYVNGHIVGKYIPIEKELTKATIEATDLTGNSNSVNIDITTPQVPPSVDLTLVATSDERSNLSLNGNNISAHLLGRAVDASGIVHERTRFYIDGQSIPYPGGAPLYIVRSHLYQRGWYSDKVLAGSKYAYNYGVNVAEGLHSAKFKVTDFTGLSNEAKLDFEVIYKPRIYNFKTTPYVSQQFGAPFFSALITDIGKDLDRTGIIFKIDGVKIASEKIYYDEGSGYFSVDGPLNLKNGRHTATIIATDRSGNTAQQSLQIFTNDNIEIETKSDFDVEIDSYSIWEVGDHNNDGQTNPGETIRLFLSAKNNSPIALSDCAGSLVVENTNIVLENSAVQYHTLEPSLSTLPLRGFELVIGDDILDSTIADPYEIDMAFELQCANDESFEIPFKLPIFKPTLPVGISSNISVSIDKQRSYTGLEKLTVTGTIESSHSFIQEALLFVNGEQVQFTYFDKNSGKFEAVVPLLSGSNIILVEAYDESGAFGQDQLLIRFQNEIIVKLDSLPRSTTSESISIRGTAETLGVEISEVQLYINNNLHAVSYNRNSKRFNTNISLQGGGNTIKAVAYDENGNNGSASAYITKTSSYTPPSVSITSPSSGSMFICSVTVNGRYDTGSSTLDSFDVNSSRGAGCTVTSFGGGTFSAECDMNTERDGTTTISAELQTNDGVEALGEIWIEVGDCS